MAGQKLSDYIKVYHGTLKPAECEALIARFEASPAEHDARSHDGLGAYSFTQLDVARHWPEVNQQIERILLTCFNQYQASLNVRPYWPASFFFENLRLKRYLPGGRDRFAPHVDVISRPDAARFATAILYLNTPPAGGETVFTDLGISVPPEPGKMIVFPPLWTFPHAGMPPKDGPKYILHSYLWYP